jgi:DNA mismatch endonuclease, patch repair protein
MRKDKFTKFQRSEIMSRIKSKGTNFEKIIFKELKKNKIYFRTHYSGVIGKPDIALPKLKKAVFLHSDFWHGWRFPVWKQILPNDFWKNKIHLNRVRDRIVTRKLRRGGWRVLIVWGHQIKNNYGLTIHKIVEFLGKK